MNKDLIDRLNAEAESCAEEGLDDIAALLDEARAAIEAQSVPDWSNIGAIMEASAHASNNRHLVGTTNWASCVSRYMLKAAPQPAQPAQPVQEPVAPVGTVTRYLGNDGYTKWAFQPEAAAWLVPRDLRAAERGAESCFCVYKSPQAQPAIEAQSVPADCDVRKIMLAVVPGEDGSGHEVYAKNISEVEAKLSEMGDRLEKWELGIWSHAAAPQPAPHSQFGSPELGAMILARCIEKDQPAQPAQPLSEADPFTYIIQHLNSSPYALTKDECITKIKELRSIYQGETK